MSDRLIGYVNDFTGEATCASCADPVTSEPLPEYASDTTRDVYDGERISSPLACRTCGAAILGELDADGLHQLAEELRSLAEFCDQDVLGAVEHAEAIIRMAGALTRAKDREAQLRSMTPAQIERDQAERRKLRRREESRGRG